MRRETSDKTTADRVMGAVDVLARARKQLAGGTRRSTHTRQRLMAEIDEAIADLTTVYENLNR